MDDDIIDAVADAVAADLVTAVAADTFDIRFAPERSNGDWEQELTDDELHVDVVAVTTPVNGTFATRGSFEYKTPVDIYVRKRIDPSMVDPSTGRAAMTHVKALRRLVFQIQQYFLKKRLVHDDIGDAQWDPEESAAIRTNGPGGNMRSSGLRTTRQFVGMIRVPFLVTVEL